MLVKPLKLSKRRGVLGSGAQSSGLSVSEKTSSAKVPDLPPAGIRIGGGKKHAVSAVGARAVNLLVSSVSEEDASPCKPCLKRARRSPSPEASSKSSGDTNVMCKSWLLTCFLLDVAGTTLFFLGATTVVETELVFGEARTKALVMEGIKLRNRWCWQLCLPKAPWLKRLPAVLLMLGLSLHCRTVPRVLAAMRCLLRFYACLPADDLIRDLYACLG
jgi:hypothetical protein